MSNANAIFSIRPYLWEGQWVFDDADRGLLREPFVGGADTIITVATESIPDAHLGFVALFSAVPFPGHQIKLRWKEERDGGNVYEWAEMDMLGWLCPALLKFFTEPPKTIYVQLKPCPKPDKLAKLAKQYGAVTTT